MELYTNAQLELLSKHLDNFSTQLGRHCAGLRLLASHLPTSPNLQEGLDSHELLNLLIEGLTALHMSMEEELGLLPSKQ